MSEQDAEIARLRGALETARGVLEQAEFALNNCGLQPREACDVEHEEALGAVRLFLREIDAALRVAGE